MGLLVHGKTDGPSRGGQGQNRRYREIGTLNFSRTLQTARNNLSPDTAAAPEITYASYVLCGHESDFFPTTLETLTQKDPLCLDMGLLVLRYGVTSARRWRAPGCSRVQKKEIGPCRFYPFYHCARPRTRPELIFFSPCSL